MVGERVVVVNERLVVSLGEVGVGCCNMNSIPGALGLGRRGLEAGAASAAAFPRHRLRFCRPSMLLSHINRVSIC